MKGLLLRLSALDADAESAARLIGFFDALVAARADLDTVLRSTARLGECPVGIAAPGRGIWLRSDPAGVLTTSREVPPSAHERDAGEDVRVWMELSRGPLNLDEILIERFAITVAVALDRAAALPAFGDPALVELVVADSVGEAERSRALHLLGLVPTERVRLVAIQGPADKVDEAIARIAVQRAWVRHAPLGSLVAVVIPGLDAANELPATDGLRVGLGPTVEAIDAARSWRGARVAFRFTAATGLMPAAVSFDRLGARATLAELSRDDIDRNPDVAAIDRLAGEPSGSVQIDVLTAFVTNESVRKAAATVYRHHSTVASRLTHAERILGFALDSPDGRFRLQLALLLRALRAEAPPRSTA